MGKSSPNTKQWLYRAGTTTEGKGNYWMHLFLLPVAMSISIKLICALYPCIEPCIRERRNLVYLSKDEIFVRWRRKKDI